MEKLNKSVMTGKSNKYVPLDRFNRQTIELDESLYEDDEDMKYLLRRLKEAVDDSELRQAMDREDEVQAAIMEQHAPSLTDDKQQED